MTELGLYFSRSANGVSQLHGKIAQDQFPDFAMDYITNGVYHPYWLGKSFRELFDIRIPGWRNNPNLFLNLENTYPWNRSIKFNMFISFFNSLIWSC